MIGATDFHSHILPGMDDGSSSLEESISMLRMEAEQGITHVVATPHFYAGHDRPDDFLARRDHAETQLRQAMVECPGLPKLSVGAEVYYFRGISTSDFLRKLTIRGTSFVMVEMPDAPWQETALREVGEIQRSRGVVPIIAHIDRYIAPFRTHGIPAKLMKMPVLVQANAEFFLGRATASMAMRMLREDQIHLLGSDCHNMTSRKPNVSEARELILRRLGADVLDRIDGYSADILRLAE